MALVGSNVVLVRHFVLHQNCVECLCILWQRISATDTDPEQPDVLQLAGRHRVNNLPTTFHSMRTSAKDPDVAKPFCLPETVCQSLVAAHRGTSNGAIFR